MKIMYIVRNIVRITIYSNILINRSNFVLWQNQDDNLFIYLFFILNSNLPICCIVGLPFMNGYYSPIGSAFIFILTIHHSLLTNGVLASQDKDPVMLHVVMTISLPMARLLLILYSSFLTKYGWE